MVQQQHKKHLTTMLLDLLNLGTNRERMSGVDTAWLRMDRPYNHMIITSVMICADRIDLETLRRAVASRFLLYKRFKQRVVELATGYYWETDPHFELSSHVRRIGLPGAAGKKELEELVGDLMSTPLDSSKPLWQFHLVEDYQGGSVSIARFHHCYADGIALIHVMLSLTEKTAAESLAAASAPVARPAKTRGKEGPEFNGGIFKALLEPIGGVVKAGIGLVGDGVDMVTHPSATMGYVRQGTGLLSEAARLALLTDDPPTRFKGKPGVSKCVAWAEPLPLLEVKEIGKVLGCSINDVLLSCAAGALGHYLAVKGDPMDDDLTIRATVPVNLRSPEKAKNLGNYFGLVMLTLPIGIENPLKRLHELRKCMEELKGSYQAILALGLLEALGLGPKILQASVTRVLTKKATAVMTNVPGPQQPLYFAGARIAEQMFWVPQTGSIGIGFSILSYNGRVHFGLVTDKRFVDDPQLIVDRFSEEFEQLLLLTMMEPWDRRRNADEVEATVRALRSG